MQTISFVIPCYRSAQTIGEVVAEIREKMRSLTKYDMSTLRLARNEIYARKGRRFKAADLQAYFDAQPWYYGYIDPAAFDSQEKVYLNQYELANARLILKYEKGEIHA